MLAGTHTFHSRSGNILPAKKYINLPIINGSDNASDRILRSRFLRLLRVPSDAAIELAAHKFLQYSYPAVDTGQLQIRPPVQTIDNTILYCS